jgi:hypothetical protein
MWDISFVFPPVSVLFLHLVGADGPVNISTPIGKLLVEF